MVKIYKDGKTMMVTNGAFESMYEPFGWEKKGVPGAVISAPKTVEAINAKEEVEEEIEKPLSEYTSAELREKAKELGVDITGMKKKKEVMEAIAEKLSEPEED